MEVKKQLTSSFQKLRGPHALKSHPHKVPFSLWIKQNKAKQNKTLFVPIALRKKRLICFVFFCSTETTLLTKDILLY